MIVRPAGEPRFDLGRLVGGVIIHDDMDIEAFRDLSVDLFEELQELDRPVTLVAFADDKPRGNIESSNSEVVPCRTYRGRRHPIHSGALAKTEPIRQQTRAPVGRDLG